MIINVEGPDGVGKSQYGEWLARELGYAWISQLTDVFPELDDQNMIGHIRHRVVMDCADAGMDFVTDRGPLSSIVYSRVFNREVPEYAWDMLTRMDPVILYFMCDPDELRIRHPEEMPYESITDTYASVLTEIDDDYEIFVFDTSTNVLDELDRVSADIATGEVSQ